MGTIRFRTTGDQTFSSTLSPHRADLRTPPNQQLKHSSQLSASLPSCSTHGVVTMATMGWTPLLLGWGSPVQQPSMCMQAGKQVSSACQQSLEPICRPGINLIQVQEKCLLSQTGNVSAWARCYGGSEMQAILFLEPHLSAFTILDQQNNNRDPQHDNRALQL